MFSIRSAGERRAEGIICMPRKKTLLLLLLCESFSAGGSTYFCRAIGLSWMNTQAGRLCFHTAEQNVCVCVCSCGCLFRCARVLWMQRGLCDGFCVFMSLEGKVQSLRLSFSEQRVDRISSTHLKFNTKHTEWVLMLWSIAKYIRTESTPTYQYMRSTWRWPLLLTLILPAILINKSPFYYLYLIYLLDIYYLLQIPMY